MTTKLTSEKDRSKSFKRTIKSLKRENSQIKKQQDHDMARTQKRYEKSLGEIRTTYEKSHRQIDQDLNELETMALQMKQKRAKLSLKHRGFMKTVEGEFKDDECISQSGRINMIRIQQYQTIEETTKRVSSLDNLEQTSKFSQPSHRNEPSQIIDNEGQRQVNNSFFEKTTPRSSRPNYVQPQ